MIAFQKLKNAVRMARKPLLPISELMSAKRLQKKLAYPEAFDNFTINPNLIKSCIKRRAKRRRFVSGGDWDVNDVAPISEVRPETFSTVHAMFIHNIHYKDTEQYLGMVEDIYLSSKQRAANSSPTGARWCKTLEDIDEYFRKLIRAHESMKKNGYKPQSQVAAGRSEDSRSSFDEILVLIGRNGELILGNGGTHRLIIAQLLGLKRVHVRVSGIHEGFLGDVSDWKANIRDEVIDKIKSLGFMHPARGW